MIFSLTSKVLPYHVLVSSKGSSEIRAFINPSYTGNPKMGTSANSENPDEIRHHDAAFHHGLHCFLRLKQHSATVVHRNLENSTCDPLRYTMGSPILIVSIWENAKG